MFLIPRTGTNERWVSSRRSTPGGDRNLGRGRPRPDWKRGSVFSGPEDLLRPRSAYFSWEHIIRPEISGRGIGEVRGVEGRVAQVGGHSRRPVAFRLLHRALAAGRHLGVDQRMLEQLLDRAGDAVAVQRIGVLVAGDHEHGARRQAAEVARYRRRYIRCARAGCSPPRSGSRRSCGSVTVLGSVEDRRRGMADQEMHHLAVDLDGNIPVTLGGEAEHVQLFRGVPVGRFRRVGSSGSSAGHILPQEELEGADGFVIDREA
jgi:hypothetical protein